MKVTKRKRLAAPPGEARALNHSDGLGTSFYLETYVVPLGSAKSFRYSVIINLWPKLSCRQHSSFSPCRRESDWKLPILQLYRLLHRRGRIHLGNQDPTAFKGVPS